MEVEVKTLKSDLQATKSALKLQTVRCRQLVAAFTRKLQEKEAELRESKDLRDQQLSRLLRALLILESRLKKEQKLIRQQLLDRDAVIERQETEIFKLRRMSKSKKRVSIDNSELNATDVEQQKKLWSKADSKSTTTGEERLDNLCRGITSPSPVSFKEEAPNKVKLMEDEKKKDNAFKDNPVLESVNQILLRDEEDLLTSVQQIGMTNCTSVKLTDGDTVEHSLGGSEWYETDNSLVVQDEQSTGAWCISVVEEGPEEVVESPHSHPSPLRKNKATKNTSPNKNDVSVWAKEKTSPPTKAQHSEEKACLEMSKKTLTIAQHKDLEEVDSSNSSTLDRSLSPRPTEASYQELKPVHKNVTYQSVRSLQKPPALPPKPPRLLKPYQILHNHSLPPIDIEQNDPSQSAEGKSYQSVVKLNLNNTEKQQRNCQLPTSTRHKHPVPAARTSHESGLKTKYHVQEMKRNQMNGHIPGNVKPQESFDSSINEYDTSFTKPLPRTKSKEEMISCPVPIRIGSSVSSLITGSSGDSIVTELSGDQTSGPDSLTNVSQLVRQFEVLGTSPSRSDEEANELTNNFEEFKLDESYVESVIEGDADGRPDGDGAEARNMVNHYATLSIMPPPLPKDPPPLLPEPENKMYETFLETTGLSQKSILTPSRMLSNHRSCLKPKDVKHRSRVKAAAVEKCNSIGGLSGSTVKYWTEPFL